MADAERWAAGMSNPAYAIRRDRYQSLDGTVEVVSEGNWKLVPASYEPWLRGTKWSASSASASTFVSWIVPWACCGGA